MMTSIKANAYEIKYQTKNMKIHIYKTFRRENTQEKYLNEQMGILNA